MVLPNANLIFDDLESKPWLLLKRSNSQMGERIVSKICDHPWIRRTELHWRILANSLYIFVMLAHSCEFRPPLAKSSGLRATRLCKQGSPVRSRSRPPLFSLIAKHLLNSSLLQPLVFCALEWTSRVRQFCCAHLGKRRLPPACRQTARCPVA